MPYVLNQDYGNNFNNKSDSKENYYSIFSDIIAGNNNGDILAIS